MSKDFHFKQGGGASAPEKQSKQPKQPKAKKEHHKASQPAQSGGNVPSSFTAKDGNYTFSCGLRKGEGRFEKGLVKKKMCYGAIFNYSAFGGKVSSIKASYRTKTGEEPIKGLNLEGGTVSFDVCYEDIPHNQIVVSATCKFSLGLLSKKVLKMTICMNI